MKQATIFRSLVFATLSSLLIFSTRALSFDDTGTSGDGAAITAGTDGTQPAPEPPPGPSQPNPQPPPMAPGGGTGGTIGSLPSVTSGLLTGGLPPGLIGAGAFLASGVNSVAVAGPPKSFVSAYGWVVNGQTIFGGFVFQQGPVLYFPTADIKSTLQKYGSLYLMFYGADGSPLAMLDVSKIF
jgi:hypothetical protein